MSGIIGDNTGRGTGLIKSAGGGKLLQVVGTSVTDTDTTTSVNSWVDYGMSQAITPTAAGSKILICVAVDINADGFTCCKVVRDIASGGYGNIFYLSTNAMGSNVTASWKIHKKGAYFANPCFTQIHPTCIPVSGDYQSKLTLMSESLRNDGRI